ncbi:hypothetical protein [uncultured Ruminococcus sp.]|uniref:hypothetical protein n=1 Tax=uncultured Ruminococcus sp. TaxID=165186 RepID=UPI00262B14EE|nr:hypothetical protein [uncultured Ruminococcus sp.]
MSIIIKRAAALMAAAVITVGAAVSCSSKKSSSDHEHEHNLAGGDIPEGYSKDLEDMPYGGEFQKFQPGENDFPLGIDMDPRFVTTEEATALTNYFYAINNQDEEALKKALHPDFLEYRLENSQYGSAKEFLEGEYELLKQYTGSDFTFDYVLIDGRLKDTEGAFETYDKLIETASPGCNITSKNMYMVDVTYHKPNDDGSYSLRYRFGDYMDIAVYTIDGKAYVVS